MMKSHGHQQVNLYNELVDRARKKLPGLSVGTMYLMFGFDAPDQLLHALGALEQSGHLAIITGGRFPALELYKDKYKALRTRSTPLFIPSGTPSEVKPHKAIIAPPAPIAETPALAPVVEAPSPSAWEKPKVATSPIEAALRFESERPTPICREVTFRLSKPDFDWMQDALATMGESASIHSLARQFFEAEIDRRRSPLGEKYRITAKLTRAAIDAGKPVITYALEMAELGLLAAEMNRKGF